MKPASSFILILGLLAAGCGAPEQPFEDSVPELGLAQREDALVQCAGAISCEWPVNGWQLVSTACGYTWSCQYPIILNTPDCRSQREPSPECIAYYEPGPTTLLTYQLQYYCTMPGGNRCLETEQRVEEGACHC